MKEVPAFNMMLMALNRYCILSSQTEQVPSNIQAQKHRYLSFAGVDNINGIRYSLNHR